MDLTLYTAEKVTQRLPAHPAAGRDLRRPPNAPDRNNRPRAVVAVDVAEVAGERVLAWLPVAEDRDIALVATPAGGGAGASGARGMSRLAGGFSGPSGTSADGPAVAWIG